MGFDFIKCLLCDNDMLKFMTTFFTDKDGVGRHGSICVNCYWKHKIEEK